MHMRAMFLSVLWLITTFASTTTAQDVTAPNVARPSRVDASAPLSGGERWVKDNGRWRLERINYRYLDHANYAPRPAPPPTIDDFPEPQVALRTRWFSGPRWGSGWGQRWGYSRSPWGWDHLGYSGRYGGGYRGGYGGRSRFGFSFGWGGYGY